MGGAMLLTGQGLRWLHGLPLLLLTPVAVAAQTPAPQSSAAPAVAGVLRVVPVVQGGNLRLALSRPLPAAPSTFVLADPIRLVIDLKGASSERREVAGSGAVKAARVSQFDPETVRIVIDLAQPMRLANAVQDSGQVLELHLVPVSEAQFAAEVKRGRVTLGGLPQEAPLAVPPGPRPAPDLQADSNRRLDEVERAIAEAQRSMTPAAPPPAASPAVNPQGPVESRVITPPVPPVLPPAVTVTPRPAPSAMLPPVTPPATTLPPAAAPRDTPVASARPPRRGRQVVVIDAGHGGKDPGAPAVNGRHEKEATLAIARAIRDAVQKKARARNLPIEAPLTRETDYFIPLGGRVRLARQWGANLFLSIHADSAANADARGASVYTLSDVASDKEAARLAAKENRADLIAGVDLSSEKRDVANILIDLGLRDSMNASSDFAQTLQRAMEPKGVKFRTQFHRFAGFAVLRNLGVPAALLETGYVSNTDDADFLFSREGQQAVADGVADAIIDYLTNR